MKKMVFTNAAVVAASALILTACSNSEEAAAPAESSAQSTAAEESHDHDHGDSEGEVEVASLPTRILIAYDGGLQTLDVAKEEVIKDDKIDGFMRLNDGGDGRHALVTRGDIFQAYDTGLITKPHGDHDHYYTAAPELTDTEFEAPKAGHAVVHDGLLALFSDGTGEVEILPVDDVDDPGETTTLSTGEPHHGVAVPLEDGSVVTTVGNEDERFTIRHVSADGETLAETTDCPNIHGEAVAGNGNMVFGCTDGPVVFDGEEFHKVDVSAYAGKDGYQRSGNLAGSEESDIVLGDNKTEEDADFERPTSIALINSADNTAKEVELGSSYWFRSLARGPLGEALVLTYDGNLNIIDPETGEVTDKVEAISEWTENEEWQQPGPILKSADGYAYITDAAKQELVVVDLHTKEVTQRIALDHAPVEIAVL